MDQFIDYWNDLTLSDKARMIRLAVQSGLTDLNTIHKVYNKFADGGEEDTIPIDVDKEGKLVGSLTPSKIISDYPHEERVRKAVESSNANWVQRLRNNDTKKIYNSDGTHSTHKMNWAEVDGKYYVYPTIQEIDGKLVELPDDNFEALDSAINRGDYMVFDNEGDARYLAENHYKKYFDSTKNTYNEAVNSLANGGYLDNLTIKPFSYSPIPQVRYANRNHIYDGKTEDTQQINTYTINDNKNPFNNYSFNKINITTNNKKLGNGVLIDSALIDEINSIKSKEKKQQEIENTIDTIDSGKDNTLNSIKYIDSPIKTILLPSSFNDKEYKPLEFSKLSDNEYLNNQYINDKINELKTLSKGDLKNIQITLANNGYYDINPNNMSKEEIKSLQLKLYNKGLLGTDKTKAVDGIWGNKSKEAYRKYNEDGILGNKTINAYKQYIDPLNKWKEEVSTKDTEWCAEWVTKKVENSSKDNVKRIGVYGNAWNMPTNVVNSGGSMIFNIYDDPRFSKISSVENLKDTTSEVLKEQKLDYKTLKIGDIVGIYMPSSNMHETALTEGQTFNTHVGVITGFNESGIPIVEHNIHTSHRKDLITHLTGSKYGNPQVTTVARPKYNNIGNYNIVSTTKPSKYVDENDNELFKSYAESISGSKEVINKIFPNVDIDEVEKATLAVQGRETYFMNRRGSDLTGIDKLKYETRKFVRDEIRHTDPLNVSLDLNKMKLSTFTSEERSALNLNNLEDLNNPVLAGRAALYIMAKNYDYFVRLSKEYPELDLTKDDLRYLTELSYNQGMNTLRTIGFTNDGVLNLQEIDTIRNLANPDTKIKDINSTNFKYLGDFGKWLYKFTMFNKGGNTPYIAAAEKYLKYLESKNN